MTQPSLEQIQFRLQYWSSKAEEYVAQSKRNNGTLKQQQWWELEYFRTPYLTAASDGFLRQRFIDHFHNCARLTKEGRISIVPLDTHDGSLIMPLISHLNLEISARGGIRGEWLEQANVEIDKYFENRPTRGEQLLKGMPVNISGVVVKFAEKSYERSGNRTGIPLSCLQGSSKRPEGSRFQWHLHPDQRRLCHNR